MRSKLILIVSIIFLAIIHSFAQVPAGFNYQGVLRNSSGEIIKSSEVSIRISILQGSITSNPVYTETHVVTTNNYGIFTMQVGSGNIELGNFNTIDWSDSPYFIKTELDENGGSSYSELGTVPLLSVPYAMFANDVANKDDADSDPQNEIQSLNLEGTNLSISGGNTIDVSALQDGVDDADNDSGNELQNLNLKGDTLSISNGNQVILPDSSRWEMSGNKLYYNSGNVGVGSNNPVSKLEVKSTATSGALFQVINANNDTVFAVYPDGVKVFVNPDAKGKVGGFAVSGRSPSKSGSVDYMRITGDSTRIYVNENSGKAKVGGFAVSGRSPSKGVISDYLVITGDSTRIYVNDTISTKAKVGGFAVSGRSPSKGAGKDILLVTADSTRIYVNESSTKAKVGGFAVSGRSPSKGTTRSFMDITKENYLIGHESGQKINIGLYNSTLGYQSGYALLDGESNAFIGYQSGYNTTNGNGNLFIGYQTGFSNQAGDYNTFLGYQAGFSNTDGLFNTYLGSASGYSNQSGDNNTFVGDSTGYHNTGSSNSFYGTKTGLRNNTGYENVFIGNMCGYNNTSGFSNVYIGNKSGYKSNTMNNVIIGNEAGFSSTGGSNVIIGSRAAKNATSGNSNVIIGRESALNLGTGFSNVFIGEFSGQENGDGFYNVYVGKGSGQYADGAGWNVSIGTNAGQRNTGLTNVFIGTEAGQFNEGSGNIMIGAKAGQNNNGYRNVFIGTYAGQNETGSKKLFIEATDADSSMALIYGDFDTDWVRINDALGIGRNPETNHLEVEGSASKTTAGSWLANSDQRIKTDIHDVDNAFETILKLRPVKFRYTDYWKSKHPSIKDQYYYNFIAQEYQQVFPESVQGSGEYIEGDSKEILQIDTYNAQIVTIKAVQDLIIENKELKDTVSEQSVKIAELEKKIENIMEFMESK